MSGYLALEQWQYQDPEKILIREQTRSCLGCIYVREVFEREFCGIDKRFGRGCESKREAENGDA